MVRFLFCFGNSHDQLLLSRSLFCHICHLYAIPHFQRTRHWEQKYLSLRSVCSIYTILCYNCSWCNKACHCKWNLHPSYQNFSSHNYNGQDQRTTTPLVGLYLYLATWATIGLCDVVSQAVLVCVNSLLFTFYSPQFSKIYRCWLIWGRNIRVIIIPSILAFACLGQSIVYHALSSIWLQATVTATWLAADSSFYIIKLTATIAFLHVNKWGEILTLTGLAISLTVNAVVTGLIVIRIVKVYLGVRSTSEDRNLGTGGGNGKLKSIIFIIIESGMAMFSIQLVRVVLTILRLDARYFVVGINQMFNVIIQSVISFFHLTEIIHRD